MADHKGKKGVSGTVLVNGKRLPRNFKCISGYVVQVIRVHMHTLASQSTQCRTYGAGQLLCT